MGREGRSEPAYFANSSCRSSRSRWAWPPPERIDGEGREEVTRIASLGARPYRSVRLPPARRTNHAGFAAPNCSGDRASFCSRSEAPRADFVTLDGATWAPRPWGDNAMVRRWPGRSGGGRCWTPACTGRLRTWRRRRVSPAILSQPSSDLGNSQSPKIPSPYPAVCMTRPWRRWLAHRPWRLPE